MKDIIFYNLIVFAKGAVSGLAFSVFLIIISHLIGKPIGTNENIIITGGITALIGCLALAEFGRLK
jgi:hypothetical protein